MECVVYLAASRVAYSGCKPSCHLGLLPTPKVTVGQSHQLILLCLYRPGSLPLPKQSQLLPCQWVLKHSSCHLLRANEFKTLAERKEIWGTGQMQTASSCYKANVALLKPPSNPALRVFTYIFALWPGGGEPSGRGHSRVMSGIPTVGKVLASPHQLM